MHVKWVALVDHDKLGENNDDDPEDERDAERLNQNRYTRFLGLLLILNLFSMMFYFQ